MTSWILTTMVAFMFMGASCSEMTPDFVVPTPGTGNSGGNSGNNGGNNGGNNTVILILIGAVLVVGGVLIALILTGKIGGGKKEEK